MVRSAWCQGPVSKPVFPVITCFLLIFPPETGYVGVLKYPNLWKVMKIKAPGLISMGLKNRTITGQYQVKLRA